jgi:hypothetical protein
MKTVSDVTKVLVLFLAACASSWQASAGPIIGDKEWYQPADLLGYSWNDFNAICSGGACNGLLGGAGPNLTGWTWASIYEVGDLFAATSPHPGGISTYQAFGTQPYANFITNTGFVRTTDNTLAISFGLTGVAGFTSTPLSGGGMAYIGLAQMGLGFPQGPPFASRFSTETTYPTSAPTSGEPYIGGWLYRAAEVPVPASVWLVALGVIVLRRSRSRTA